MSFNQGIPGPATLINSSSTLLYGNAASANALSVQQLGAGNVATFRTTTGATALFVNAAGNVGIGQTNPVAPLSTVFSTSGIPDTTGSGTSNVAVRFQVGSVALDMGNIVNGNMWLQNHLITNWATNFKLLLNPNGGSVGIGTTDPGAPLDVTGRIRTTQDLMVESTAAGANYSVMRVTTGGDGNNYIQSAAAQSGGSSANLIFTGWFGSPESMRIASTGRVGIGTASPACTFHMYQSQAGAPATSGSTDANIAHRIHVSSIGVDTGVYGGGYAWIQPRNATNYATNYGITLCPNGGKVGIGTTDPATALHVYGGAITTRGPSGVYANLGGYMKPYVYTGVVGGLEIGSVNTSGTELPTIYISDGSRVGIGTTNPAAPLEVGSPATITFAASYGFYSGSGFTAGVTGNQSVGAKIAGYVWSTNGFLATSDARIKIVNPEPISNCLDAVNQLRVCKYEYIDKITDKSNKLGFIAQEVQQVIPESVTISESIVPNIFKMAESVQSNVITIANHGLVVGDTVKLVYGSGAVETNVCVVRDASTFQVEAEIKEESVFVYGKKVNDFLTLDHTQVFTCAIGAIQELSAENTVLKTQLASIEARLAAAGL